MSANQESREAGAAPGVTATEPNNGSVGSDGAAANPVESNKPAAGASEKPNHVTNSNAQTTYNTETTNNETHNVEINHNYNFTGSPGAMDALTFELLQKVAAAKGSKTLPEKPTVDSTAKDSGSAEPDLEKMPAWQRTIVCVATIFPGLNWFEFNEFVSKLLARYPAPPPVLIEAGTDKKLAVYENRPSPLALWEEDPYVCLRPCGLVSSREGIAFSGNGWRDAAVTFFTSKAWLLSQKELGLLLDSDLFLGGTANQRAILWKQIFINLRSDLNEFGPYVVAALAQGLGRISFASWTKLATPKDAALINNAAEALLVLYNEPALNGWLADHVGELMARAKAEGSSQNGKVALIRAIHRMAAPPPEVRVSWLLGLLANDEETKTVRWLVPVAIWSWFDGTPSHSELWLELARQLEANRDKKAIRDAIVRVVRRQFFASILAWRNDPNVTIMTAFLDPERREGTPEARRDIIKGLVVLTVATDGFADSVLDTINSNWSSRFAPVRLLQRRWLRDRAEAFARCLIITAPRETPRRQVSPKTQCAYLLRAVCAGGGGAWAAPIFAWMVAEGGEVSTAVLETIVFDLCLQVQAAASALRRDATERCGQALADLLLSMNSTDSRRVATDYLMEVGGALRAIQSQTRKYTAPRDQVASQVFEAFNSVEQILQKTIPRVLRSFQIAS